VVRKNKQHRNKRRASERSLTSTPAATPNNTPEKGSSVDELGAGGAGTGAPVGGDATDTHSAVAGNPALTPSLSDASPAPRRALSFACVSVAKTSSGGARSSDSGTGPAGVCRNRFVSVCVCDAFVVSC
jgi:hypothetical protein